MFLLILGSIVTIVSFFIARGDSPLTKYNTMIRIIGILIMVLGAAFSMFKVIDAGQVGVKPFMAK